MFRHFIHVAACVVTLSLAASFAAKADTYDAKVAAAISGASTQTTGGVNVDVAALQTAIVDIFVQILADPTLVTDEQKEAALVAATKAVSDAANKYKGPEYDALRRALGEALGIAIAQVDAAGYASAAAAMTAEASKNTDTAFANGLSQGTESGSVQRGEETVYVFLPETISPN